MNRFLLQQFTQLSFLIFFNNTVHICEALNVFLNSHFLNQNELIHFECKISLADLQIAINCIRSSQNAKFTYLFLSPELSIFIQCKSMPEKHQWMAYNCARTNNSNRNLIITNKWHAKRSKNVLWVALMLLLLLPRIVQRSCLYNKQLIERIQIVEFTFKRSEEPIEFSLNVRVSTKMDHGKFRLGKRLILFWQQTGKFW